MPISWQYYLRQRPDAFGATHTDVTLQHCPWRWPGQYQDEEVGLYYNRLRYFDPGIGSYISQDPTGLEGGISVYSYVSDPCRITDPFGLEEITVYHYTTKDSYNKIGANSKRWVFKASQPPADSKTHPKGVYFTTLGPQTKNLAGKLGGLPREKIEYVFKMRIDESLLKRLKGGRGKYILYISGIEEYIHTPSDLDYKGKSCGVD